MIMSHSPEYFGHFGMIPLINHDSRVQSNSVVVIKFTQIMVYIYLKPPSPNKKEDMENIPTFGGKVRF